MNNLPLQPLVWDWSYGDGGKTNAVCRAKSPSHEYIIRMEAGGDCYVDYRKFDNDEDSDNRKDEPPVFDSVSAAQEWAQFTHYPSKMQPYVVSSQVWISVDDRLPESKELLTDKDKCVVLTECGKVWTGFYNMHIKPDEWYLHGWTQKEGWHPFKIVAWMLASDLSKQGE